MFINTWGSQGCHKHVARTGSCVPIRSFEFQESLYSNTPYHEASHSTLGVTGLLYPNLEQSISIIRPAVRTLGPSILKSQFSQYHHAPLKYPIFLSQQLPGRESPSLLACR